MVPTDVTVRAMTAEDWPAVRRIYAEGIASGLATFETSVPSSASLDAKWLPNHRWVAEIDGEVAGWTTLTLQTAIFTENHASIALYLGAGYRTVGVRERIAKRDDTWHDTVLIERRAAP